MSVKLKNTVFTDTIKELTEDFAKKLVEVKEEVEVKRKSIEQLNKKLEIEKQKKVSKDEEQEMKTLEIRLKNEN